MNNSSYLPTFRNQKDIWQTPAADTYESRTWFTENKYTNLQSPAKRTFISTMPADRNVTAHHFRLFDYTQDLKWFVQNQRLVKMIQQWSFAASLCLQWSYQHVWRFHQLSNHPSGPS